MPLRLPLSLALILFSVILFIPSALSAPGSEKTPSGSSLSLPYSQNGKTENTPDKTGTTIYKKDKTFDGYNIYTTLNFVYLIDIDGTLIHSWERHKQKPPFMWQDATPFPDGSIFVICEWSSLNWQWVNASSHILASYETPGQRAHTATYCLKDGSFLGLVANMPFEGATLKIKKDSLVRVSSQGKVLKTIPLSKLFAKDPLYQKNVKEAHRRLNKYLKGLSEGKKKKRDPIFDPTHTVYIENLEWNIPGIAKKGDWLVTARDLNRIFIVDPDKEKIVWQWGENIVDWVHHATFLQGDQILLFDNGIHKKSSRVIVLDIRSKNIVWQYGQKPGQEFFTLQGGGAQRLPNGNTLITESEQGHIFEVTASGEIVWEWYEKKQGLVYYMKRLPRDFFKGVKFNYGKTQP